MSKILEIIVSLGLIAFGLSCFLNPKFYKELVKAINAGKGLRTTITPQTTQIGKGVGIIAIIIGTIIFLITLSN
ncbi:MAG: hypothetical protein ACD_38C00165G0020 [uncultured bacterium]|uniref:Uncharacterized protein n=1 Tax=Candidatus Daviesbacteria bacterium GW2011_GWC2_40_12 TaxID=1618431 RepID=A0A0G0TW06_9BACT|nr:MAG: hypothetical protein ACD_38C00165G0020 [uncultured bacterium]KKQ85406.1 MAG: hypothetical protein UT04_C0004G0024 [Candidatus Daviesbacteria bacterium GW2011_GWF2_38_7]KKR17052.1 MAG: hypothetical protein UT45_C0003G0082 [Candidatus Daviesbacteria bacterium GW2011_GWA2_39_33]KKR23998.1 MAG: hypothetical protein UT54_C0034G0006 [Candidatus Daviesbacteria bacterium GW2011_GWB1_39_5]KKR42117.1 MAG: hypothetical protein UT77_C0004G0101 [Candidatus Daviesbacteria bacterium GW2011_GWC2_40_12]